MATTTQTVQNPPRDELPTYQQAAESKYELDWADLVTLDLSQFDLPDGKQKLAKQLRDAVHNVGFFYVSCSSFLYPPQPSFLPKTRPS